MSRGSKHLLLERDSVSVELPFRASSPSVARRQYGHALFGEEAGLGPRGRLCLISFGCLYLCGTFCVAELTELHLAAEENWL